MAANTSGVPFASDKEGEPGLLAAAMLKQWHKRFNISLTETFLAARESVQYFRSIAFPSGTRAAAKDAGEGGGMINIFSTRASLREPNSEGYGVAKAGLLGLTDALAPSFLASFKRCNAMLPGWIPSTHKSIQDDARAAQWDTDLAQEDQLQHWIHRVGRVEHLAKTVEGMAACGFLNAQVVALDGGMTKKMTYIE